MKAIRALSRQERLAALPAIGLVVCLFLPWYRATYAAGENLRHDNQTAFGAFSFVEAAVLVVAGAVLFLLWSRAQRRGFHLPGGDGTAISIAGGWTLALLVWRLFDRPDVGNGDVGVQWGIFVAMVMAGLLLAVGQQLRAAHVVEPPNPAETGEHAVARPSRYAPRPVADMPTRRMAQDDLDVTWDDAAPTRRLAQQDIDAADAAPTRRLPREDDPPPPPPPPPGSRAG